MRADAAAAIASMLLGALLATGCRTTHVNEKLDPDPGLQSLVRSAETAEMTALPEGSAKTLVTERCLLCHGAALIVQQRKDAAAWGRTVTQMRTWGAQFQEEDQAALVAYLAEHFGPGGVRQQR
jgi:cytochrome c5